MATSSAWMLILLLQAVLLLSLPLSLANRHKHPSIEACEKKVHVAYNAKTKEAICQNAAKFGSGPADCASLARDKLHSGPEEALALCQEASSAAPVLCVLELPSQLRKSQGVELCAKAEFKLPGTCFAMLSETKMRSKLGGRAVTDAMIMYFCSQLSDVDTRAPLECVSAAIESKVLSGKQALEICIDARSEDSTATAQCLHEIKSSIGNSHQSSLEEIGRFCASLMPEMYEESIYPRSVYNATSGKPAPLSNYSAVHCFLSSASLADGSASSGRQFSIKERLHLCLNAPPTLFGGGPISCASAVLASEQKAGRSKKITNQDVSSLCQFAVGEGPAVCFFEGSQLPPQLRMELCQGATNAGPVHCQRRAATAFKKDPSKVLELCIGAVSSGPGECAAKVPITFSEEEKAALCQKAASQRAEEPFHCFQSVESASKMFIKNNVGSIKSLTDFNKQNRESFINMCSFSNSQSPLASAECLKSAPNNLLIDEVVGLCTNVSSAESLSQKMLCMKALSSEWTQSEAAALCEHSTSRRTAEAIGKCAVDLMGHLKTLTFLDDYGTATRVSKENITSMCLHESPNFQVISCVKEAAKPSNKPLSLSKVISVCGSADSKGEISGKCLATLANMGNKLSFAEHIAQKLCQMDSPLNKIVCLDNLKRREISLDDLNRCENEKREVSHVILKRLHSIKHNEPFAIAGNTFSVLLQVQDQYRVAYGDLDDDKQEIFIGINDNNEQNAVLWGPRRNSTYRGYIQFSSLIVSQGGPLELKFYRKSCPDSHEKVLLGVYTITVREDPALKNANLCLNAFTRSSCGTSESDYEQDFPRIKGYLPASECFQNIRMTTCSEILPSWGVEVFWFPDDSCYVEYRSGVDVIWTGRKLPTVETPLEERLGLSFLAPNKPINKRTGKQLQKELKKAYYKHSLQWHPDRWASLPRYVPIVQGIFELGAEAYEKLSSEIDQWSGAPEDA